MLRIGGLIVLLMVTCLVPAAGADDGTKTGPLMTRWAADVTPERALPEYPRPQMVRAKWQNLNGLWDYAVRPKAEERPAKFDGQILVPFPIESALSRVMQRVDEKQRVWYRRTFEVPADWQGQRVLLHFGAVDWDATVWVNGKAVGQHQGGYDPFTFDVTDALKTPGPQELVVAVWDPTDTGPQARGKQVSKPEGIWYTPTTGIWRTVWLEPVPQTYIAALKIVTDVDAQEVEVTFQGVRPFGEIDRDMFQVVVLDQGKEVAQVKGSLGVARLKIPDPKLWSPETPYLYDLRVTFNDDEVTSYFGMRQISLGKDELGRTRLMLNNKPVFMFGPLDQGFWPDGLYTAPTDEALRFDIEFTKKLGFNMARKHVKVEPDRWYYWCDKLGLLVWQDMPSGDKVDTPKDWQRPADSSRQFELELERVIDAYRNHPCIVMWVPFNEGWGQYDTARIVEQVRKWDPTRLVNSASGWHEMGVGDVHDIHVYPGPGAPPAEEKRAGVLGEFGGLGLPVSGHTWQAEKNWGYVKFASPDELTDAYLRLIPMLRALQAEPGLSAAVYTQTTDVEIEVNGLMTYDRAVIKMDAERIAAANRTTYGPPPVVRVVVPTAQAEAIEWGYTTEQPAAEWMQPTFDDTKWKRGPAGFGADGTPGAVVRTKWDTADIWLRRKVELKALPAQPQLKIYHDEDCEVFVNGKQAAAIKGYVTNYVLVPLTEPGALRVGENIIAVHCHQTRGGQGVDVGIVDVTEPALK